MHRRFAVAAIPVTAGECEHAGSAGGRIDGVGVKIAEGEVSRGEFDRILVHGGDVVPAQAQVDHQLLVDLPVVLHVRCGQLGPGVLSWGIGEGEAADLVGRSQQEAGVAIAGNAGIDTAGAGDVVGRGRLAVVQRKNVGERGRVGVVQPLPHEREAEGHDMVALEPLHVVHESVVVGDGDLGRLTAGVGAPLGWPDLGPR